MLDKRKSYEKTTNFTIKKEMKGLWRIFLLLCWIIIFGAVTKYLGYDGFDFAVIITLSFIAFWVGTTVGWEEDYKDGFHDGYSQHRDNRIEKLD